MAPESFAHNFLFYFLLIVSGILLKQGKKLYLLLVRILYELIDVGRLR